MKQLFLLLCYNFTLKVWTSVLNLVLYFFFLLFLKIVRFIWEFSCSIH